MCIYLQMNATCRISAFMFELPPVYDLVTQLRFDRLTGWPMKNKRLIVKSIKPNTNKGLHREHYFTTTK